VDEPSLADPNENSARQLLAVGFELVDGEQVVSFQLSQPATTFELARRDHRTFVLTIPSTAISTLGLGLPQYPPQEFEGITFIHPQGGQPKLLTTIGVENGVKLTAIPNGSAIYVKVESITKPE
jgi:hypothetical protein